MTDGGEGLPNPSAETRLKQRNAKLGRKYLKRINFYNFTDDHKKNISKSRKGIKFSKEHLSNLSLNRPNKKSVINIDTGEIFLSVADAKPKEISKTTFHRWLKRIELNRTDFRLIK